MKTLLFSLVSILLITTKVFGQNEVILQVFEEKTKPIPFAQIQLLNTLTGGVTDLDGIVKIRIPANSKSNNLRISHMGFMSDTIHLNDLKIDKVNTVILKIDTVELNAVNIVDIGMSPKDFMARVFSQIEDNFETSNYLAKGFYVENTVENNSPSLDIEAEILWEAEGLKAMLGKNKYTSNIKTYLSDLIFSSGQLKEVVVEKARSTLSSEEIRRSKADYREDNFLDFKLTYNYSQLEKNIIFNNTFWEKLDWYYSDLKVIDESKLVLVKCKPPNENFGELSYWIDISSLKIRQVNLNFVKIYDIPDDDPNPNLDDLPKRMQKQKYMRGKIINYPIQEDISFNLHYFDLGGKNFLKAVNTNFELIFLLDQNKFTRNTKASFTVEEILDNKSILKDYQLTKEYPHSAWWIKN